MKTTDKEIQVQLHKSDFISEIWNSFKENTYWYHVVFLGEQIIKIVTWESNYPAIQKMYNFK